MVVAGVKVLQPPRAGLARAVCALAADELQEGQGGCPRGPQTDEGVEEGAVLLEVESFPLPPGLRGAGGAKLPVHPPAKADHLGRWVQVPAQVGVHVCSGCSGLTAYVFHAPPTPAPLVGAPDLHAASPRTPWAWRGAGRDHEVRWALASAEAGRAQGGAARRGGPRLCRGGRGAGRGREVRWALASAGRVRPGAGLEPDGGRVRARR